MSPHFILLVARGIQTESLFVTDALSDALRAVAALAHLVPELRLVLYVSILGEASRRLLTVDEGLWRVEGVTACQQEAA